MDDNSNINDQKEKIRKFCEDRDWDQYHNAKELTIGIVTEASELLQIFRFKTEKQIDGMFLDESKRQEISEELADIFYFLLRLSQRYGIDLTIELNKKLLKNEKRYPIEKSKGSNKRRGEY